MTNLITEARELCEKATPGPWEVYEYGDDITVDATVDGDWRILCDKIRLDNAEFVARSRTLIPELVDALEKAQAEIERLRNIVALQGEPIRHFDTVTSTIYPLPAAPEEGAEHERD